MKILSRRAFLAAGITAIAAWAVTRSRVRVLLGSARRVLHHASLRRFDHKDRLISHFSYLRLDPQDVATYLEDYVRRFGTPERESPDVLTRFLLSTDFFPLADESKPLRYQSLFDPYASPCWNPLARFDD